MYVKFSKSTILEFSISETTSASLTTENSIIYKGCYTINIFFLSLGPNTSYVPMCKSIFIAPADSIQWMSLIKMFPQRIQTVFEFCAVCVHVNSIIIPKRFLRNVTHTYNLPSAISAQSCKPRLFCGSITQWLLVTVISNTSQPISGA